MQQDNNRNENKNRKSEAQKRFDEADNAGRFAGDDADAQNARNNAEREIQQQAISSRDEGGRQYDEMGDAEARQDPAQAHTYRNEAQNINHTSDGVDTLRNDTDMEHARNKATQGINEGRDTGSHGNTDMNRANPGT